MYSIIKSRVFPTSMEVYVMIFNTAKVMSKGQITLPVDIRKNMKLSVGDRVALIYENNRVIMMNPAIYAMEVLQKEMESEWEKVGIHSEEDINILMKEIRTEVEST
jgi:AbrB family looped-hinge helix DNA binding protein